MADREPRNNNRLDLYRRLLPGLIEADQKSNAQGYVHHWDDPDAEWDTGSVEQAWDAIGLSPVIQELFWVIEKMAEEDLVALESLDVLVDPLRCPEDILPQLSASFGYALDETQPEQKKRLAVQGLMEAYKSRGTFIGFKVFYRLIGFNIVDLFPLWKKDVFEAREDYSRIRYRTTPVSAEPVGPAGIQTYTGQVSDGPVRPGSVRITDGTVVLRDEPVVFPETIDDRQGRGDIIGPTTESGTINYATGEYTISFTGLTAGAVTIDYDRVDEEWPYHAARIDIEINISPGGGPVPLLELEDLDNILRRLDDVRPIHVLLRALAIVIELTDDFTPAATDQTACTTVLKNVLSGIASPPTLGLDQSYILDGALTFASHPGEDEMSIFQDFTVGTDRHNQYFEDRAAAVCPLDTLRIVGPPGGPIFA